MAQKMYKTIILLQHPSVKVHPGESTLKSKDVCAHNVCVHVKRQGRGIKDGNQKCRPKE